MAVKVRDSSGQPAVAPAYTDRAQMLRVVFGLKSSAGRGLVQFGEQPQEDGGSLAGFAVQLRSRLWRVIVFRGRNGGHNVADDFLVSASGLDEEIAGVRQQGGMLAYTGYSGQELLVRRPGEGGNT